MVALDFLGLFIPPSGYCPESYLGWFTLSPEYSWHRGFKSLFSHLEILTSGETAVTYEFVDEINIFIFRTMKAT